MYTVSACVPCPEERVLFNRYILISVPYLSVQAYAV